MNLPIMRDYAQSPSDFGWLNTAVHKDRSAIDIGWRLEKQNWNQPAYSLTDALVFEVGYLARSSGHYIVAGANYDSQWDLWWSVQHLQNKPSVVKGSQLTQGQKFGNMGNTGESYGEHFHVRISFVPKGTPFSWSTFNNTRYNPFDYVFAYRHQDVTDLKKKPNEPFIKESQESNLVFKDQLGTFTSTHKDGSNIRKQPSRNSERVGGLPTGQSIQYTGYVDAEGFRWIKTDHGWIARRTLDNKEIYGEATLLVPKKDKVGQILKVRESFPRAKFTAYFDKACTRAVSEWTRARYDFELGFKIIEDHDPVFRCAQYGRTPMGGVSSVYIKYEPGIGFD